MTKQNAIKLFEEKKVRAIWDDKEEKWWFSIVDVVAVLTYSADATAYWRKLKQRLKVEGNETVTICHGLKMLATDGKMRLTDVADTEQLLRLIQYNTIQSIPSPKAEPFKLWLANVASGRIDQMQDPELSINQALTDYKRLGYSDNWINQRLKSIEIRKNLTDEWKKHGLQEGAQFATLTDIIHQTWSNMTAKEYKIFKSLKKENLCDNMTKIENEKQYQAIMMRIEELLPLVDETTPLDDNKSIELVMLSNLVADYDEEHYPMRYDSL